jgi:hypothetical protein
MERSPSATSGASHARLVGALRRHPAAIAVAVILLAGGIPSAVWELWPDGGARAPHPVARDGRYATQGPTQKRVRQTHLAQQSDEFVDGALETCGALGVRRLATRYGVATDPRIVARRFAGFYDAGYREAAFRGCLEGLYRPG